MFTYCANACKKNTLHILQNLQSTSEFGRLWKHPNNPACTESVRVQNVEVGYYTEEEKKEEVTWCFTPSQPVRLHKGEKEKKEEEAKNHFCTVQRPLEADHFCVK